jgi:hypothetical protein
MSTVTSTVGRGLLTPMSIAGAGDTPAQCAVKRYDCEIRQHSSGRHLGTCEDETLARTSSTVLERQRCTGDERCYVGAALVAAPAISWAHPSHGSGFPGPL